jgi:DNA-binding response OmpR family regulator
VRALIAEDDRVTARVLARTLEQWGLDVLTVHDGDVAWRAIQEDPSIGFALLDWMMPGLDGPSLCRRVRGDQSRAHLYIIILTAREGRADLIAGLDAGADDYLVKPFDPEELRARVQVGRRVLALQERLNERVGELEAALSNVKQLQGLLPICSYCKKVRSDEDYWEQVEHYVGEHTDVKFSHSICPDCFDRAVEKLDNRS